MLVQLQEANCIFIHNHTFLSSMAALFSSLENCLLLALPVAAMVPDVKDSDLWMQSVKYPPDGEFLSEADENLPAAA